MLNFNLVNASFKLQILSKICYFVTCQGSVHARFSLKMSL